MSAAAMSSPSSFASACSVLPRLLARCPPLRHSRHHLHPHHKPVPRCFSAAPASAPPTHSSSLSTAAATPNAPLPPSPVEPPLVAAFVNNIMKKGKKATARRIINTALAHVASEAPQFPSPHAAFAAAVEKAAPLFKIVGVKHGAKSIQTPTPLTERQRTRTGIVWIAQAANSSNSKIPGGVRIGKEIIDVLNGTSSVLQKRLQVHKTALLNRSNVVLTDRRLRKF
ncbi:hypothetical protein HDU83_006814 [Entophlyctis luteolus]|nr:hypothetical protein HDU83_006814 [Entophlyctis luteolus]KAJ3381059.1 hypothetical protein HDU84_005397 [Entophlyctis sp. JEL0112]